MWICRAAGTTQEVRDRSVAAHACTGIIPFVNCALDERGSLKIDLGPNLQRILSREASGCSAAFLVPELFPRSTRQAKVPDTDNAPARHSAGINKLTIIDDSNSLPLPSRSSQAPSSIGCVCQPPGVRRANMGGRVPCCRPMEQCRTQPGLGSVVPS